MQLRRLQLVKGKEAVKQRMVAREVTRFSLKSGVKVTRGVWAEIERGGYVAQTLVKPSERMIKFDDAFQARKMDVRLYTYDGQVLLVAARLYQGQTTNFRTPGGGFAPVFVI